MTMSTRLGVIVAAICAVLAALRFSTTQPSPPPDTAVEEIAARPSARTSDDTHTEPPALSVAPVPAPARSSVESRPASTESDEPALLDFEADGLLGALRAVLDRGPVDSTTTRAQQDWAESELDVHHVEYLYFDVRCTSQLCRAEAGFNDMFGVRDLGAVQLPSEASIVVAPVVRRPDRPGLATVLYWGVDGFDLGSVVPIAAASE